MGSVAVNRPLALARMGPGDHLVERAAADVEASQFVGRDDESGRLFIQRLPDSRSGVLDGFPDTIAEVIHSARPETSGGPPGRYRSVLDFRWPAATNRDYDISEETHNPPAKSEARLLAATFVAAGRPDFGT